MKIAWLQTDPVPPPCLSVNQQDVMIARLISVTRVPGRILRRDLDRRDDRRLFRPTPVEPAQQALEALPAIRSVHNMPDPTPVASRSCVRFR